VSLLSSSATLRRPPPATLFPYTTLFRSCAANAPPPSRATASRSAGSSDHRSNGPGGGGWLSTSWVVNAACIGRPRNGLPARLLRSEEHTSELQSRENLVCRLLLEKKKKK